MEDLIDRQAAIDMIRLYREDEAVDLDELESSIAMMPSEQPEIIRCKDCKHYQEDHLFRIGFCDGRQRNNNDFCSRAVRKGEQP